MRQAVDASDGDLARAVSARTPGECEAAESELYRRFAPRVRLYGRRHLQDHAAADDLVQDVLLVVIERLRAGEVRQPGEIGSFILGTSRMMAHSERRVAQRRSALTAKFMDAPLETAPPSTEALDVPRLAACLSALEQRDRMVVLLTFYADRDSAGIGEELGVTSGAVRVIRHRAMARLRDCVLGGVRS